MVNRLLESVFHANDLEILSFASRTIEEALKFFVSYFKSVSCIDKVEIVNLSLET